MATTAAEYLAHLTAREQAASTLPITFRRPTPDMAPEVLDPGNNIGRMCDVRSAALDMDHRAELGWQRAGRTWQIIRYHGTDDDGRSTYVVVHVDDPESYGMVVRAENLTNLW